MRLSNNFSLQELSKSSTAVRKGIDNTPDEEVIGRLQALCENVLQPVRDHFGRSVMVSSGYRSPELNTAIGGSATSDHCKGFAADIEVAGVDNFEVFSWIRNNCSFSQLILEFYTEGDPHSGWVHVSYNPDNNKQECLRAIRGSNGVSYNRM